MKKIVAALFLGLSLSTAQAIEMKNIDMVGEDVPQPSAIELLDYNPNKFSDLVRTTMDLMGPEAEKLQVTELATAHPPK
ncbi:MAG: hypothetical protein H0V66_05870 [Bdellovibrionales bacterium]|nr:hypothetical protein [Bdellovibrionales bacterium]